MSRDYIDNPAEDAAFTLRRIDDTLSDLLVAIGHLIVIWEMVSLTGQQREELHKDDPHD